MPARFVGLHLALVILIGLYGLNLVLDPCRGAGDFCPGGPVGMLLFGVAGFGAGGIGIWQWRRRASPLLLLDSVVVTFTFGSAFDVVAGGPVTLFTLGLLVMLMLGLPAAALAGREVAGHAFEATLIALALAGFAVYSGEVGMAVLIVGLVALGVGWLLRRPRALAAPPARPNQGPDSSRSGP